MATQEKNSFSKANSQSVQTSVHQTSYPHFPQNIATADILDQHIEAPVLPPIYKHFGGRHMFSGPCVLVSCFEDNSKVKLTLSNSGLCETTGLPQVLVVDGGGSLQCALLGDMIAKNAVQNQWAGVLIHGCVRDSSILATLDIGVLALASTPRKSKRRDQGVVSPPNFKLHDVPMEPGFFVYADLDGVVILPELFS